MTAKFNIFDNGWSKKVISADLNEFDSAIEFIKENKCDGLQLQSPAGTTEVIPDFQKFKSIADLLLYLSIDSSNKLKKVENVKGIYELKNLQKLVLAKEAFELDLSHFKKLHETGVEYSSKLKGLSKHTELEILVLRKYPKGDLTEFTALKNLRKFHVYQSKIISAKGIDELQNLEEVNFSFNKDLNNIQDVLKLQKLQKVHIEKCEKLADFNFDKNTTIRELFITSVSSLKNIEKLTGLEMITFWDLKDGDLTPLLKLPALKEIRFHPHKKHYSHTKEEINKLLKK